MRRNYYGEKALAGLRALGPVLLHEGNEALRGPALVAAAQGARIIVADRMTPGPAAVFAGLPDLAAFAGVAVHTPNVHVDPASPAARLVARPGPRATEALA